MTKREIDITLRMGGTFRSSVLDDTSPLVLTILKNLEREQQLWEGVDQLHL